MYDESMLAKVSATPVHASNCHARIMVGTVFSAACIAIVLHRISMPTIIRCDNMYFAESFNLTILEAVEEEAGSEASAAEIIHLINLVANHELPAVFTEKSGSDACAGIISAETGAEVYMLDMAMAGNSYFKSMYHNIDTIKEALG